MHKFYNQKLISADGIGVVYEFMCHVESRRMCFKVHLCFPQ